MGGPLGNGRGRHRHQRDGKLAIRIGHGEIGHLAMPTQTSGSRKSSLTNWRGELYRFSPKAGY